MLLPRTAPEATPGKGTLEECRALQRRCRRFRLHHHPRASRARDETSRRLLVRAVPTAEPCAAPRAITSAQGLAAAATLGCAWVLRGQLLVEHSAFFADSSEMAQTLRCVVLISVILVGRPAVDLFLGLTDVICPDGGSIDEGMARDAWLETVASLDDLGIDDAAVLTASQMQEIFLAFVAHTIEARLFQDIGVNGLKIAADLVAIEVFEAELRSYIRRSVRDSFSGDLGGLATLSDLQIMTIVDSTYEEAWDLLVTWGDTEE